MVLCFVCLGKESYYAFVLVCNLEICMYYQEAYKLSKVFMKVEWINFMHIGYDHCNMKFT